MTTPTTPEQPEPSALSVPEQIALKAFGISHHAYDTGVMIDKEDVDEIASAIEAHVQRELASTRAASAEIVSEWRRILHSDESIYSTTPKLRDELTKLAAVSRATTQAGGAT